ncbi:MAG TPA: GNAT family N-acetyltransferase [Roseiflexaceae bacterium]|nr:GNAT family N-acetyltransferase [Roseiflexaceae bacterium]
MALATWWISDPLPGLRPLAGFTAALAEDDAALARLNRIPLEEVRARRAAGHRPYVGALDGVPVTYGWVATREASIGELGLSFRLPEGERYLWDFATLPEWQGRGLYPRLLQAILAAEVCEARRFWIIHAPENLPSGAGMGKAGLEPVGALSFDAMGGVALRPTSARERAAAGARLLGVPLIEEALAPCWHCGRPAAEDGAGAACWPPAPQQASSCTCAVQPRPPIALAGV